MTDKPFRRYCFACRKVTDFVAVRTKKRDIVSFRCPCGSAFTYIQVK